MTTRETGGIVDEALGILKESGAGDGEIYLEDHAVFTVAVADHRIESLESQEVRGAGLRLFEGGRVAFSYTTDLSGEGLRETARLARSLLERSDPDEANRLPAPPGSEDAAGPDPEIHDPSLSRVEQQDKIRMARRVEEAARAADPRVTRVRQSRYTDVAGRVEVANTTGLRRSFPFSRVYASIELNAEAGGELQSGWYADFAIRFSGLDPVHIGREAAQRAVQKLGATRIATRRASLVLDPVVAAGLTEAIAPAFHADNVLKGKSLMAGRVGQVVGSPSLTLLDDGRLPGGDHAAPYDAEGVPTRCTTLIGSGTLMGFLHSTYTSIRLRTPATGNSSRASFKTPPHIAPSNLYLQPTGITREALLAQAGDGIYVTEVMGLHTIDPISGDFSVGAAGLILRDGRPGAPVDRIGIAGNILDLLRSVAGVATDLRLMPGGGAGASTLLTDISVSGS